MCCCELCCLEFQTISLVVSLSLSFFVDHVVGSTLVAHVMKKGLCQFHDMARVQQEDSGMVAGVLKQNSGALSPDAQKCESDGGREPVGTEMVLQQISFLSRCAVVQQGRRQMVQAWACTPCLRFGLWRCFLQGGSADLFKLRGVVRWQWSGFTGGKRWSCFYTRGQHCDNCSSQQ